MKAKLQLIGVSPETKEKLIKLKMHPRETFDDVIVNNFYKLEMFEDEKYEQMGEKDGEPQFREKHPIIKPEKIVTWRDD